MVNKKVIFLKTAVVFSFIVLLPALGIYLKGRDIIQYLKFPHPVIHIKHAPFSLHIFIFATFIDLMILLPLATVIIKAFVKDGKTEKNRKGFPWWGYAGFFCGIIFWILAWSRFPWFKRFQSHTFTPLWLSYIIVVNAISYKKDGSCTITKAPFKFFLLFPASAIFWWLFEYLNRFVQNWYYINTPKSALIYFLSASISFSTVLPAVISTRDLLLKTSFIKKASACLKDFKIKIKKPVFWAFISISFSCICLFFLGIFPDYLFSLIWICPLMIIVGIQTIFKERHIFSDLADGNWELLISTVFSILICGLFWEMWNYYSFAKWKYSIPFVNRFHIFEMPVLGYAGYIPFGLACVSFVQMLKLEE